MNIDDTLLTNLLQADGQNPKISIYQSTQPVSTGQTVQEDAIRFKNALQSIRSNDAYDEAVLAETMASLDELVTNREFWSYQARGLAVFADQDGYQPVRLGYDVTEAQYVGHQYQVSPLLLAESLGSHYYLLDVSHARPRLCEGSQEGCTELTVEGMPESLDAMTENIEFKKELQHQSGGVGTFHGHNDKSALQDSMMAYYRAIAEALDKHLTGQTAPLVLMGVQNRVGTIRPSISYANTLEDYVEGSGDAMNEQALHEHATPIVEKYYEKQRHSLVDEFKGTPPDLTVVGAADIDAAAAEGRVAKLLLPYFRRTADTVRDTSTETVVLQLPSEGTTVEALVRTVLAQGGEVVAVAVDAFGDERPRAMCRF